jgi:hypothetical protein
MLARASKCLLAIALQLADDCTISQIMDVGGNSIPIVPITVAVSAIIPSISCKKSFTDFATGAEAAAAAEATANDPMAMGMADELDAADAADAGGGGGGGGGGPPPPGGGG